MLRIEAVEGELGEAHQVGSAGGRTPHRLFAATAIFLAIFPGGLLNERGAYDSSHASRYGRAAAGSSATEPRPPWPAVGRPALGRPLPNHRPMRV